MSNDKQHENVTISTNRQCKLTLYFLRKIFFKFHFFLKLRMQHRSHYSCSCNSVLLVYALFTGTIITYNCKKKLLTENKILLVKFQNFCNNYLFNEQLVFSLLR